MNNKTIIFTDGSSSGNPGPGGWGAVILFEDGMVREYGGSEPHTTNNRMELVAAIMALRALPDGAGKIFMYPDSAYVVRGITSWIHRWRAREWKTAGKKDVENRDLWEELFEVVEGKDIVWQVVPGHSGVLGNERADAIATGYTKGNPPKLFVGTRAEYGIDISDISHDPKKKATHDLLRAGRLKKTPPAYSYVSFVDGIFMRHATWAECEKRVKGVRGAKFKKAFSREDEQTIARAWGA